MNEDEYHGTNREEDRDGASMGKKDGKEKRDLEFGREGNKFEKKIKIILICL